MMNARVLQPTARVIYRTVRNIRLFSLRFYSRRYLARIGREHQCPVVRAEAWRLNGAFEFGRDTHFNWHVSAVVQGAGQLAARLGERVAIAPNVTFVAASGPCKSRLSDMAGFAERHIKYAPITVGDDTWIGAHVVILPGIEIGKRCVLGAGSVVTRDVPDDAIVAGVPARIVGTNGSDTPDAQGAI